MTTDFTQPSPFHIKRNGSVKKMFTIVLLLLSIVAIAYYGYSLIQRNNTNETKKSESTEPHTMEILPGNQTLRLENGTEVVLPGWKVNTQFHQDNKLGEFQKLDIIQASFTKAFLIHTFNYRCEREQNQKNFDMCIAQMWSTAQSCIIRESEIISSSLLNERFHIESVVLKF